MLLFKYLQNRVLLLSKERSMNLIGVCCVQVFMTTTNLVAANGMHWDGWRFVHHQQTVVYIKQLNRQVKNL